jgi:peptidoglycan/LPS O-acetylase OafA/YrhL
VLLLVIHIKAEPPVWTARLGELGFTLYLLHWPAFIYSKNLLKRAGLEEHIGSPIYLVALLTVLIPLSYLVYHRFERPLQRWIKS